MLTPIKLDCLNSCSHPHASEGPHSTFSLLILFCARDSFHLPRDGSDVERQDTALLSVLIQGPGRCLVLWTELTQVHLLRIYSTRLQVAVLE